MTGLTVLINQSGLAIAMAFVVAILVSSIVSRWIRSTELRFEGFDFADDAARRRWDELCRSGAKVLVPHRPGLMSLADKSRELHRDYRLDPAMPIIFIEAVLGDPSNFYQNPLMQIEREGELEVIRVSRCVSVSHVLASICLELCRDGGEPPEIIFGWSNEPPLAANLNFLLLGEGKHSLDGQGIGPQGHAQGRTTAARLDRLILRHGTRANLRRGRGPRTLPGRNPIGGPTRRVVPAGRSPGATSPVNNAPKRASPAPRRASAPAERPTVPAIPKARRAAPSVTAAEPEPRSHLRALRGPADVMRQVSEIKWHVDEPDSRANGRGLLGIGQQPLVESQFRRRPKLNGHPVQRAADIFVDAGGAAHVTLAAAQTATFCGSSEHQAACTWARGCHSL